MPAFRTGHPRCRLYQDAPVALTAGNHSPYVWPAVDYDDVGQWDGMGTITIERTGLYFVSIGIGRASGGGTASAIGRVLRSGNTLLEVRTLAQNGATLMHSADEVELDAGDAITTLINLNATATATLNDVHSHLTVNRVGPKRYTGN